MQTPSSSATAAMDRETAANGAATTTPTSRSSKSMICGRLVLPAPSLSPGLAYSRFCSKAPRVETGIGLFSTSTPATAATGHSKRGTCPCPKSLCKRHAQVQRRHSMVCLRRRSSIFKTAAVVSSLPASSCAAAHPSCMYHGLKARATLLSARTSKAEPTEVALTCIS